jgi:hypothetical protein
MEYSTQLHLAHAERAAMRSAYIRIWGKGLQETGRSIRFVTCALGVDWYGSLTATLSSLSSRTTARTPRYCGSRCT